MDVYTICLGLDQRGIECLVANAGQLSCGFHQDGYVTQEKFYRVFTGDFTNEDEVVDYIVKSIKKYKVLTIKRQARFSVILKASNDADILEVCIGEGVLVSNHHTTGSNNHANHPRRT